MFTPDFLLTLARGGVGEGVFGICCCLGYIVALLLALGLVAFWIWMLIEVVTKEPAEEQSKVMWILIVALLGWIGALVYYFARRPKRKQQYGQ